MYSCAPYVSLFAKIFSFVILSFYVFLSLIVSERKSVFVGPRTIHIDERGQVRVNPGPLPIDLTLSSPLRHQR